MHPSKTLQIDGFLLSAAVVINYYAFASSIVIGNLVWKHIFNAFSGAFGYAFYQQTIIRVEEYDIRAAKHL